MATTNQPGKQPLSERLQQSASNLGDSIQSSQAWNSIFRPGSIFRKGYTDSPRNRSYVIMNSVLYHLHPVKVKRHAVKVSYTLCLGGLSFFLFILLTVTGNATRVRPATNAIFSNVPGSRERLYMEGAELEAIYPLSIVTDGMGLNITVVSHVNKLCFAIASCPTEQPGVEHLGKLLKESYANLREAVASYCG